MNRFDVVVSGAGAAGAVAALGCAQAGLDVGLIERQPPVASGTPNARVVALAPASARMLERLQLWPLPPASAAPYARMEVRAGAQTLHFDAAAIGEAALGWITDLEALQQCGWQAVSARMQRFAPARIEAVERGRDELRIRLDDDRLLRAKLLVIAEGARSEWRERLGFETRWRDYGASGLVATVRTEVPNPGIAFQRFAAGGPLALLPLHGGASSIVWTRPTEAATQWLQADRETLSEALTAASGGRFGRVIDVSAPAAFPLRMAIADRFAMDRVALIGDSAHVVHPLAGLGLNLGLLDAAALVEVVTRAQGAGRDPGGAGTLTRYATWREGDTRIAAALIDAVERIFGGAPSAVQAFAEHAIGAVDALPLLKRFFALQAAGLAGRVPSLAR